MKVKAENPGLLEWSPNHDDEEKWRVYIAKKLHVNSKNWNIIKRNAVNPESIERMKDGLEPLEEADKHLGPSTVRHYHYAWKRLMMLLTKKAKRYNNTLGLLRTSV